MHKLIAITLFISLATPAFAEEPPQTEEQKTLYAIGLVVARSLSIFNLSPAELEIVKQGLTDASSGKKPVVELSAYNEKVQMLAQSRRKSLAEKSAASNKEYLEKAAKETGALQTESGLIYIPVKDGSGASPETTSTVKVNYRGTLTDGKEFDSSYKRKVPAEFRLDGVIKCWSEGLQKMKPGGKARLICPPALAYGDSGAGETILPGAILLYEVELLEVKK